MSTIYRAGGRVAVGDRDYVGNGVLQFPGALIAGTLGDNLSVAGLAWTFVPFLGSFASVMSAIDACMPR